VDRVAPGAEVEVSGGTGQLTTGLALATVRVVPLSTPGFSLFLIGRAGRLLLSDHPDGWAAGGGGGVIIFTGARIGVQLGYEVLELVPSSFCADLSGGSTVQGFQLGLVAGF